MPKSVSIENHYVSGKFNARNGTFLSCRKPSSLSRAEIESVMHLKQRQAAEKLGISVSSLQRKFKVFFPHCKWTKVAHELEREGTSERSGHTCSVTNAHRVKAAAEQGVQSAQMRKNVDSQVSDKEIFALVRENVSGANNVFRQNSHGIQLRHRLHEIIVQCENILHLGRISTESLHNSSYDRPEMKQRGQKRIVTFGGNGQWTGARTDHLSITRHSSELLPEIQPHDWISLKHAQNFIPVNHSPLNSPPGTRFLMRLLGDQFSKLSQSVSRGRQT
uniref:RWP-RK domain-containing protein n=1 Tax=Percolomonas cosmopolitus TaxID=63605 RepID=A0A7S1KU04_9EUKA|mmetsp:Transcript_9537/g.35352  ORF Transcript_9537/g.35352 Transcript_9537/m.35352 type:complete len:276 (+) Transcript_9537:1521-2348(+)